MKNLFTACACILFLFDLDAQLSFGLTAGFSPAQRPANADLLLNKNTLTEQFYFNLNSTRSQWQGGITAIFHFKKSDFFSEAKLLYSFLQSNYTCHFTIGAPYHPQQYMTMQESESMIILPVNVGVHLDKFSIASGLSATYCMSKNSELENMDGFVSTGTPCKMGWQSSVRMNIENFAFGIEYQGRISRVGEGNEVHDQSLALRNIPGRWVFLVEYKI